MILAIGLVRGQAGRPAKPYTTWSDYGGSPDSMQYSALTQINRNNVTQLETAWFYPVAGEPERMPLSPLIGAGGRPDSSTRRTASRWTRRIGL